MDSFQAVTDVQTTASGPAPANVVDPALPELAGRFQVRSEIARGGMGVVLRAHDPAIGRDVAVKVILPQHRDHPTLVRRFLDEVRLAGQLQHPGVAPVYDLGTLPDGRPYFAMKLIEGRTLAELLRERNVAASLQLAVPNRQVVANLPPREDLPRFLRYFEAICQAVGYAHARGVLHRDLKPLNVMVGAFGEIQVMDWGLAKKLTPLPPARQPSPRPAIDGPSSELSAPSDPLSSSEGVAGNSEGLAPLLEETECQPRDHGEGAGSQAGSVVGTASYMAPEQARGETVDARCDVFGLGAILCEMLTGAPPFADKRMIDRLEQAANGDLADAFTRLDRCSADAELVRLAKACLSAHPQQRPPDGSAVAAAVAAYLGGVQQRLRQAEIAQARAEEERKRRRVQFGLLASLLVLVLAGGAGAWLFQQQRQARAAEMQRQQQAADQAAGQSMAEAKLLLEQARTAPLPDASRFREAVAAAQKAEDLAQTAKSSDEVRRQAADLAQVVRTEEEAARRDSRLLTALLEVRSPREGRNDSAAARGLITTLVQPSADEQFASAFRAWGLDVDAVSTAEASVRLKARPPAVVRRWWRRSMNGLASAGSDPLAPPGAAWSRWRRRWTPPTPVGESYAPCWDATT
jgi:serine/threonine-protein kinase